jgi:hypothetical protein
MKKCIVCGKDVHKAPNGKELGMCAVHAYQSIVHFLFHQDDEGEITDYHPDCYFCAKEKKP